MYWWTHPVARKEHQCDICFRMIAPGEKYGRCFGVDDGASVWKECAHCVAFTRIYDIDDGDGMRPTSDDIGEFEPDSIAALRARVYWSKRWTRPDGTLYPVPM